MKSKKHKIRLFVLFYVDSKYIRTDPTFRMFWKQDLSDLMSSEELSLILSKSLRVLCLNLKMLLQT